MTYRSLIMLCLACTLAMSHASVAGEMLSAAAPAEQMRQYLAEIPKTIVELQPFRSTQVQQVVGPAGRRGTATLVNLNPTIGHWYLLALNWGDGNQRYYHLESSAPAQTLALDSNAPDGLVVSRDGERYHCNLWSGPALLEAAAQRIPYAPLCEGRLYLHNAVRGHVSNLEAVVEFLRGHVWGGETLVTTAKETVLKDAGREQVELGQRSRTLPEVLPMPAPAQLDSAYAGRQIGRGSLGIAVAERFTVGQWLAVPDLPGAFLSLVAPEAIAPEILRGYRDRANTLDSRESAALVYSIAFDLKRFDLGFGVGTDHPGVEWSAHIPDSMHLPTLPGPDGVDSVRPLIASGMIPSEDRAHAVATFAGGFKRYHGAFKYGALALSHHGSHYGFVQEGVVLSKLQPGLSTLYVLQDGSVHMQAWTDDDNRQLAGIRYARQNGVPLVEWDAKAGVPIPGALVSQWGAGNWSGSVEGALRTVRAGACLQKTSGSEYLIYAYFSNATPSAMARVFQAYGCHHAMQLDINAPILTYLAIYTGGSPEPQVQYLVAVMVEAEQKVRGQPVPRFLVMPDNRDFFYLTRRGGGPP